MQEVTRNDVEEIFSTSRRFPDPIGYDERDHAASEDKFPSTKERLASIVKGFENFDSEMKIGSRMRREQDEFKISELKSEMKRLENELTTEIRRRTEMNKSMQNWFEGELSKMDKSFHELLHSRSEKTKTRLDQINVRIDELDARFETEKQIILNTIDEKGAELRAMLEKFKVEFDEDRQQRLEREAKIREQLVHHEQEVAEKFDMQTQMREAKYVAIKKVLEDNIKLREKAETRFQNFFEQEVNKLHNQVSAEIDVREREDDEIIEALNRYTEKLQTSLKIINSTDM